MILEKGELNQLLVEEWSESGLGERGWGNNVCQDQDQRSRNRIKDQGWGNNVCRDPSLDESWWWSSPTCGRIRIRGERMTWGNNVWVRMRAGDPHQLVVGSQFPPLQSTNVTALSLSPSSILRIEGRRHSLTFRGSQNLSPPSYCFICSIVFWCFTLCVGWHFTIHVT